MEVFASAICDKTQKTKLECVASLIDRVSFRPISGRIPVAFALSGIRNLDKSLTVSPTSNTGFEKATVFDDIGIRRKNLWSDFRFKMMMLQKKFLCQFFLRRDEIKRPSCDSDSDSDPWLGLEESGKQQP